MCKLTLFRAWAEWFSGHTTQQCTLWGLQMLWWGRIGKILEFLAAVTILADIIGASRLRMFGRSLHGAFGIERAKLAFKAVLDWRHRSIEYLDYDSDQVPRGFINNLDWLVWFVICAYLFGYIYSRSSGSVIATFIVLFFPAIIVQRFISPLVTLLIIVAFTAAGLAIDGLLIEPLAFMLDRPNLARVVKVTSVVLLVAGFHFDLLVA